MYSLYSFLAAGQTATPKEFQFFGQYPIMAGMRIETKQFFPRDLHRSSGVVGQRSATIEHQASLAGVQVGADQAAWLELQLPDGSLKVEFAVADAAQDWAIPTK